MNQELSDLYQQYGMKPLSRDAQVIIHALFPWANRSTAAFSKKAKIHPRTMAALEELAEAKLIHITRYKGGSMTAFGHREINTFKPLFAKPTEADSFPVTEGK